jgi:ABC-type lipoprotein export system ATPase subunit
MVAPACRDGDARNPIPSVAIARALGKWPSVIFADEPTANLDEESTETIVALMRRLNTEDRVSFVIATHDPVVYRQARATLRIVGGTLVGGPV